MRTFDFTIFADFYQFYIQDELAKGITGDSWSQESTELLVALEKDAVGVGTARNMPVPVRIEVLDAAPSANLEDWDQIVECDIAIPSGVLVVAGCTDYFPEAARIKVESGSYRVRVAHGGLKSISDDGLNGNDHYRLQLWRAEFEGLIILKSRIA